SSAVQLPRSNATLEAKFLFLRLQPKSTSERDWSGRREASLNRLRTQSQIDRSVRLSRSSCIRGRRMRSQGSHPGSANKSPYSSGRRTLSESIRWAEFEL